VRHQGKLTDWKDEKGFGFVTPRGGGPKVFVHIKSFSNRQRRPVGNELVTYELTSDSHGRPQGVNITFVGDRKSSPQAPAPGPGTGSLIFTAVFFGFVVGAVVTGNLPFVAPIVYFAMSCVTYLFYSYDKAAAQAGRRRTPESTLHLLSLIGGWPGAMVAQRKLRHKTQKLEFQTAFWLTVGLNCIAVVLLLLLLVMMRWSPES
jgi:uncharacterized membrane protein YsdA (DUF1294 family)/cold shock CspA family protein